MNESKKAQTASECQCLQTQHQGSDNIHSLTGATSNSDDNGEDQWIHLTHTTVCYNQHDGQHNHDDKHRPQPGALVCHFFDGLHDGALQHHTKSTASHQHAGVCYHLQNTDFCYQQHVVFCYYHKQQVGFSFNLQHGCLLAVRNMLPSVISNIMLWCNILSCHQPPAIRCQQHPAMLSATFHLLSATSTLVILGSYQQHPDMLAATSWHVSSIPTSVPISNTLASIIASNTLASTVISNRQASFIIISSTMAYIISNTLSCPSNISNTLASVIIISNTPVPVAISNTQVSVVILHLSKMLVIHTQQAHHYYADCNHEDFLSSKWSSSEQLWTYKYHVKKCVTKCGPSGMHSDSG